MLIFCMTSSTPSHVGTSEATNARRFPSNLTEEPQDRLVIRGYLGFIRYSLEGYFVTIWKCPPRE